jgi:plastocyanin
MAMPRSVVRIIAAGSMAAALVACGGGSDNSSTGPTPVFTSVSVSPVAPTVSVGATVTMTALAKDQNGAVFSAAPAATWSSSDETKATVGAATGVVTGVANGTPTITASITVGSITKTGSQPVTVTTPTSTAGVTATTGQAFEPPGVTIARASGTGTVTWTFQSLAHTVTWDSKPGGATVADIDVTHNDQVSRDFTVAGHYTYHCSIHPGMHGTVDVQ